MWLLFKNISFVEVHCSLWKMFWVLFLTWYYIIHDKLIRESWFITRASTESSAGTCRGTEQLKPLSVLASASALGVSSWVDTLWLHLMYFSCRPHMSRDDTAQMFTSNASCGSVRASSTNQTTALVFWTVARLLRLRLSDLTHYLYIFTLGFSVVTHKIGPPKRICLVRIWQSLRVFKKILFWFLGYREVSPGSHIC